MFRAVLILSGCCLWMVIAVPISVPDEREDKSVMLVPMPASSVVFYAAPPPYYQQYLKNPNQQVRGPFDFIGQWIQQTPWLPIQVNVPDIFQNIGNGISQATNQVQQFSQNVGNGVSQFTQNVGTGFNQFTQNVGNGFNQWMQQLGQRVPIFGNIVSNRVQASNNDNNQQQHLIVMVPVEYPGGQQLIVDEAIEAFP